MPLYAWVCPKCSKTVEELSKEASVKMICEEKIKDGCHCEMERVFSSNVKLTFKGNGFYINDYAKK